MEVAGLVEQGKLRHSIDLGFVSKVSVEVIVGVSVTVVSSLISLIKLCERVVKSEAVLEIESISFPFTRAVDEKSITSSLLGIAVVSSAVKVMRDEVTNISVTVAYSFEFSTSENVELSVDEIPRCVVSTKLFVVKNSFSCLETSEVELLEVDGNSFSNVLEVNAS